MQNWRKMTTTWQTTNSHRTRAGYNDGIHGDTFTTQEQRSRLGSLVQLLSTSAFFLAISSQNVAHAAIMCFLRYLIAYNHSIPYESDINDLILCGFVVFMALSGKHKSIRTYLSMGPRILIENMGIPYKKPSQRPTLYRILKSIDRIWGKAVTRKAPITVEHLQKMSKLVTPESSQLRKTIWAAIVTAFFSLVRKSAYCAPTQTTFDPVRQFTIEDLSDSQGRSSLKLQLTKTIQFAERDLEILLPRLDNDICPTTALANMLRDRKVTKPGTPLFTIDDKDTPLTDYVFRREFKALLIEAKIPTDDKAPHSLRRGGTTCALESGCNPTCIKIQGDWASDAYLVYIWVTNTLKRQVIDTWEAKLR